MNDIEYVQIKTCSLPFSPEISLLNTYEKKSVDEVCVCFLLHGGSDSNCYLDRNVALIQKLTSSGKIPPMIYVCPNCMRSQYMNYRDSSQLWEDFIVKDIPHYLGNAIMNLSFLPEKTVLCGISMGGLGALRFAFKYPEQYGIVAAIAPGVVPSFEYSYDIHKEYYFFRTVDDEEEIYGSPIDLNYWKNNNPAYIARENCNKIISHKLDIYLECGDKDSFKLFHGAEFLHNSLLEMGIMHEYRILHDVDHIGPFQDERLIQALQFAGRMISDDVPTNDLVDFKTMAHKKKESFG